MRPRGLKDVATGTGFIGTGRMMPKGYWSALGRRVDVTGRRSCWGRVLAAGSV